MGLFSGGPREKRYNGFTATFSNPPILPNSASGIGPASLRRVENSFQETAIWASVSLIAGLTAELPFDVFRGSSSTKPLTTPGYLLDIAGDGYGTSDWVYQFMVSTLLRGNVNGKIVARDPRFGFPTQLPLYHPDTVKGWRDPISGELVWWVQGVSVDNAQMWHRRAWPMPGQVMGLSPIAVHAQTIGLGLSAEMFGVEFFADGANPTGILTNTEVDLSPTVSQQAKERFVAGMNGKREPVVLGKGWQWQQISIRPEESQFLKTKAYTAADCARIYGPGVPEMLGYETGTPMTYQNDEQRNIHLMTYTLDPWFSRVEKALSGFLPQPQYVKLNRAALLRTDLLTRYKAHALAIAAHFRAPSEVREIEDMPPMTPEQLDELKAMEIAAPALKPLSVPGSVK